jgi:hypothetical protein
MLLKQIEKLMVLPLQVYTAMEEARVISGSSLDEVWKQVDADFSQYQELYEYSAIIEQQGRSITLDIDIDLGGGFEGGYALTRFMSPLKSFDDFRFSLHREDLLDDIGKFFGMEDIQIGYPEFDKEIVIKSNQPERIKDILASAQIREVIQSLPNFEFHIGHHHSSHTEVESAFLELRIDEGITDTETLRPIYSAFTSVLEKVDFNSGSFLNYI